jgi:hypothetical protein
MKSSLASTALMMISSLLIVPNRIGFVVSFMVGGRPSLLAGASPTTSPTRLRFFDKLFSAASGDTSTKKYPVMAGEELMKPKSHGTSDKSVMKDLRWNCDFETADRICNFNRHYAEYAGYWQTTDFLKAVKEGVDGTDEANPIQFYDSVTGKLLFRAPIGRSMNDFIKESASHGWPSFRDEEVNWDYVRCLRDGECISTTGTHLGHNIPDGKGNRYCINLVSVAGREADE